MLNAPIFQFPYQITLPTTLVPAINSYKRLLEARVSLCDHPGPASHAYHFSFVRSTLKLGRPALQLAY